MSNVDTPEVCGHVCMSLCVCLHMDVCARERCGFKLRPANRCLLAARRFDTHSMGSFVDQVHSFLCHLKSYQLSGHENLDIKTANIGENAISHVLAQISYI